MISEPRGRVVVVGGGITGLTAAHTIASASSGVEVLLLEGGSRLGGNIQTERCDGFVLDGGPDCFVRTKPEATELVKELGLDDELVTTECSRVYVAHRGGLELMPAGMALAVPTRLGPMLRTPLLSWRGKLRMLGEVFLPRGWKRPATEEESIDSFLSRRFGVEAAERLGGPLLGGINAGDTSRLSMEATFPQLIELESRQGSLIRALFAAANERRRSDGRGGVRRGGLAELVELLRWLRRDEIRAPSPFYSLRSGMDALVEALARRLPVGTVHLGHEVTRVTQRGGRWLVHLSDRAALEADAVILCAPARTASRLVADAELASELAGIPYVSTATVFLGLPRRAVAHPLDAVGFIVPKGEALISAATWVSSKWAARAPAGGVLLRAFLGGAKEGSDIANLSDDGLVSLAHKELTRLMGPLGEPSLRRVFRYPDSRPQLVVGHAARLRRLRLRLERLPGLYLAGEAYDGVGITDCIRQGRRTALDAVRHVAQHGQAGGLQDGPSPNDHVSSPSP